MRGIKIQEKSRGMKQRDKKLGIKVVVKISLKALIQMIHPGKVSMRIVMFSCHFLRAVKKKRMFVMQGLPLVRKKQNRVEVYNPKIKKKLIKFKHYTTFLSIREFIDAIKDYSIASGRKLQYSVNDSKRCQVRCDKGCPWKLWDRVWDLTGIPCSHAVRAIHSYGKPLDYAVHWYTRDTYIKTYSHTLEVLHWEDFCDFTECDIMLPPPMKKKLKGRPQRSRRKEQWEDGANSNKVAMVQGKEGRCTTAYARESVTIELNVQSTQLYLDI